MNMRDFCRCQQTDGKPGPNGGGVGHINLECSPLVQPLYQPIVEECHQLPHAGCHAAVRVPRQLQVYSVQSGFPSQSGL